MRLFLIFLIMTIEVSSQNIEKSVHQFTWGYIKSASDSVVLSDLMEPDLPFYNKITIFRKGKQVFSFYDSTIEFDGSFELFTEHAITKLSDSYLIFKCSGRPQADYFFVIHKGEKGYRKLGYAPSSTADIFGDIDCDGIFEIGGFENYHEGEMNKKETLEIIKREYKIFEVRDDFPLDSILMKTMFPIVLENLRKDL